MPFLRRSFQTDWSLEAISTAEEARIQHSSVAVSESIASEPEICQRERPLQAALSRKTARNTPPSTAVPRATPESRAPRGKAARVGPAACSSGVTHPQVSRPRMCAIRPEPAQSAPDSS